MNILITNDDGIDSAALVPFVEAMQGLGDIRVVVPAGERSWIGKAITRHGTIPIREELRGRHRMLAAGGTPADCVSLAVHSIGAPRPDLVISGINLGLNYSAAFLLSSGTVGAAIEAWIAGVPSIAFSMGLPTDAWGVTDRVDRTRITECARHTSAVSRAIVDTLLAHGYPQGIDTITVNMPAHATLESPRVVTGVTRSRYGRLFVPQEDGTYVHQFENLWATEDDPRGDMAVVDGGGVSIAPLRLDLATSMPDSLRDAFEKPAG